MLANLNPFRRKKKHLLIVCTGNLCRSPMAELMIQKDATEKGLDVSVSSAGIFAADGEPPSEGTRVVLERENIAWQDFRSQLLTKSMLQKASHIFVMTDKHRTSVRKMLPKAASKTFLLSEIAPEHPLCGKDIQDPSQSDQEAYDEVHKILQEMLPNLWSFIDRKP